MSGCCGVTKIIQVSTGGAGGDPSGPYQVTYGPTAGQVTVVDSDGQQFVIDITQIDFSTLTAQQCADIAACLDFSQLTLVSNWVRI